MGRKDYINVWPVAEFKSVKQIQQFGQEGSLILRMKTDFHLINNQIEAVISWKIRFY